MIPASFEGGDTGDFTAADTTVNPEISDFNRLSRMNIQCVDVVGPLEGVCRLDVSERSSDTEFPHDAVTADDLACHLHHLTCSSRAERLAHAHLSKRYSLGVVQLIRAPQHECPADD